MRRFYDYRCPECGSETSVYIDLDKDDTPRCQKCGSLMKKLLSAVPVQYKCGGFYCTSYPKDK